MYICNDCGAAFYEPSERDEYRGECFGYDAYETCGACPDCGSDDYEEGRECEICGETFSGDKLYGGCVCEGCIDAYKCDVDTCYAISREEDKEPVQLDAFLASMFTVEEIEEMLLCALLERPGVDCSPYIDADTDWFAMRVVEVRPCTSEHANSAVQI